MFLIGIRVLRDYLEVSCAFALRVLPYFFPSRFTIMLFYGGGSALRALLCQLWRFAPSEIIQFSSTLGSIVVALLCHYPGVLQCSELSDIN